MKTTAIILFFTSILLTDADAAEITTIHEGCSGPCAYLNGDIKPGDLTKLKAIFESPTRSRVFLRDFRPPVEIFTLHINSRGGSLEEAMEIGRWVRKNKIFTGIGTADGHSECFSSCVYILAAGLGKSVWTVEPYRVNKVGIHRPYLTQTPTEGVQVAMRKALADSRAYFAEMNIPEQLADAMFSIPPDKMEILTDDKLSFYRLNVNDIVFDEEMQLKAAALYGMTRQQYMQNRKLAEEEAETCHALRRSRSGDEKFDGQKCIQNAYKKYGLHESQKIQRR